MNEEQLKTIEAKGGATEQEARELVAEVRRLRGLIKQAESAATKQVFEGGEPLFPAENCPWCGYASVLDVKRKHAPECPAFTEAGAVRGSTERDEIST